MELADKLILLAVSAQIFLTLSILVILGRSRVRLIAEKKVKIADIATSGDKWPLSVILASNSYNSQFQLPVLFYVLTALLIALDMNSLWFALPAIAFVASRYMHAFVHMTTNRVSQRFMLFVVGLAILALMWLGFALQIILT